MRKKYLKRLSIKYALVLTSITLIAGVLTAGTAAYTDSSNTSYATTASSSKMIQVGIYYSTDALDGANLENYKGQGFYLGYYDENEELITLGSTSDKSVSIVKTENVYYGSYNDHQCYYDFISSNIAVGRYHLQLSQTYSTYEAAITIAQQHTPEGSFVAYINDTYYVRIGNFVSQVQAEQAMNKLLTQGIYTEIVGTSKYGLSVVDTGTNNIIFQYDDNGNGTGLAVVPSSKNGTKCETWFKGYRWNGAFRFERVDGGDLTVVNIVDLEDYVKGVIPYEMSSSWPAEAQKALAVCARNYVLCNEGRHSRYHFDVCNESHCQQYLGRNRATTLSDACVDTTAGTLAYYDGKLVECYYHSSNGGATESSSVVWGSNQQNYPYLLGVLDPYEAMVADKISKQYSYHWTKAITTEELTAWLKEAGYRCNTIVSVEIGSLSDTGNPKAVTFTDIEGTNYTLSTGTFVKAFSLPSYRYRFGLTQDFQVVINEQNNTSNLSGLYALDGNGNLTQLTDSAYIITSSGTTQIGSTDNTVAIDSVFTISGSGWGHNVGLSQWGAYSMAELGYSYSEILQFYYTGITLK